MAKIVRYTGGTMHYGNCSDSKNLVSGKTYEVIMTKDYGFYSEYVLNGVEGAYNTLLFEEVSSDNKELFFAFSNELPKIGKEYHCQRLEFSHGQPQLKGRVTSIVKDFDYLGDQSYKITTCNNVYIVKVE